MKIISVRQGTPEWLASRCGVITASRFCDARSRLKRASGERKAGDLGAAATQYAWTVAIERIAQEPVEEVFVTKAMERGTVLEEQARVEYEAASGDLVGLSGLVLTDDEKFGYSSDGLVGDTGLIEIKCPSSCEKIGLIWSNPAGAAAEYIDQIQGGMWITGREYCDLVVYCPWLRPVGKHLFLRRIQRDDDYIEALEQDLIEFERMVTEYEQILRARKAA